MDGFLAGDRRAQLGGEIEGRMRSLHTGIFAANIARMDDPRWKEPAQMARRLTTVDFASDGDLLCEVTEEIASLLAEDTLESLNFGPLVLTRHGSVIDECRKAPALQGAREF